jgi:two-component system chemotaxis sensor kinase CheA
MSFGEDEEILNDFLVEAGEILEQLSEQLVDLEQRPDDRSLLNAIFRGFHTVKGGAGFLQLTPLVELCHITENVFDLLRNGKLQVTSSLMDVALQALDAVNEMFSQVQDRTEPSAADPALMHRLEKLVSGEVEAAPEPEPAPAPAPVAEKKSGGKKAAGKKASNPAAPPSGDISDAEFEQFLDAIQPADAAASAASAAGAAGGDEITDDEFEALLDQIHGKGQHGGAAAGTGKKAPSTNNKADANVELFEQDAPAAAASGNDEISEDEFEKLLDDLHGGGAPGSAKAQTHAQTKGGQPKAGEAGEAGGLISDDEFENLLDQLHGSGKGPTADGAVAPAPKAAKPAPEPKKPEPKPEPRREEPKKEVRAVASADDDDDDGKGKARGGAKDSAAAETTVRVDTQRLDDIMNMVGELVLVRNRLVRLGLKSGDEEISKAVSNLDVVTADLQTSVMKTRMQPIKKVFGRFPRVVRDLARNLKKEINLELQGEETDLDKNLVEALADPLVHLVRNAVDHGIELPAERERVGKSRVGRVILAAEQEGDHILLSITDDGAGMDPDRLREKAVEKGMLEADAAARLTDTEAYALIFAPGFSTKTEISDVSGRGVGMDVVKTKISQLNGSIEIKSKIGEGSRIIIKVPLTLAIMPTLMVMLGSQTFALPLVSVNEIFHMDLRRVNVVDGQEVITVRDKALPLFYLKRWLVAGASHSSKPELAHVVIVSVGTQRVGFVVDQLIGQEEVVIKPLGKMLQGTPGMAGATITGDGRIALILDVPSMLKRYAGAA